MFTNILSKSFRTINSFFFGTENHEEIETLSLILFYGVALLGLLVAALCLGVKSTL